MDGVSNDRPDTPSFGNHYQNSRSVYELDSPNRLSRSAFIDCSVSPMTGKCDGGAPFNGNLGRNTFRGPHFADVDLSFFKNIKATERLNFQFRAEAFNLFNNVNLYNISGRLGQATSQFGLATQAYAPRQIQFALKMFF